MHSITRSLSATVPLLLALAAPAQARLLADVNPAGSSQPSLSWLLGAWSQREVLLNMNDGQRGTELWRSDGTPLGTELVVDLTPGLGAGTFFFELRPGVGAAWFTTGLGQADTLWRTDGTAAGTQQVFTAPNSFPSMPPGNAERPLGSVVFFNLPPSLARTDGTPAGTFALPAPSGWVVGVRDGLALIASSVGFSLWLSDGVSVALLTSNAFGLELAPDRLFVAEYLPDVFSATSTRVTWLDGPGTPSVTIQDVVGVRLAGDRIVLDGNQGIYAWDGTAPPTTLLSYSAPAFDHVRCGDGFLFTAATPATGIEPIFTDGTVAGTRVLDLTPGPVSSLFTLVAPVGSSALLWLHTATIGREPWVTDGTVVGTLPIGDLEPGPGDSVPEPNTAGDRYHPISQRRVVLPVTTSAHGRELWQTDGTAIGTSIVADLLPGPASSLPFAWDATVAGGTMFWFATDGVVGFEPYALDLDGSALPLRQQGTRRFVVGDPVLGGVWQLRSSSLQPTDVGFALVGLPLPVPVVLGGGQFVHFDIFGALLLGTIVPDPNGRWTTGIPLPNDPSLTGLDLVAQPLFVPSTQPVGVDLGDAWWITLGL